MRGKSDNEAASNKMHELPITESILNIVLKHAAMNDAHKISAIHLRIGALSELEDEWLQKYFDYLSKGTIAEDAKLVIVRVPAKIQCRSCAYEYEAEKVMMAELVCPACGGKGGNLISGREYYIKEMEVQ